MNMLPAEIYFANNQNHFNGITISARVYKFFSVIQETDSKASNGGWEYLSNVGKIQYHYKVQLRTTDAVTN
uniref:Uncharacterized protein n=1 Tax=Strigamia maritima TaxID=126957 RepID=T1JA35_STRMM